MSNTSSRRFVLASRPEGTPVEGNFRLETVEVPQIESGQVLVKNLWLSVDPYMRGRMSDRASYARPVALGQVMVGGTVGQVVESTAEGLSPGDIVVGYGGWQEYAIMNMRSDGANRTFKVPHGADDPPVSTALGVCGMPGCTAFFGMEKLGEPKEGDTLVVSAASGAVGSVVGQIGKMKGCRVVGVAGGPAKCRYCVDEFGFDACVDYKAESDLGAALKSACPDGVDIYFENVGGAVAEAVGPLLNEGCRVPICGAISHYNAPEGLDRLLIMEKAAHPPKGRFFLVWEWPDEYEAAASQLVEWVKEGRIKYREDVVEGFENAPAAFIGLFSGANFGKRVVKIADPD